MNTLSYEDFEEVPAAKVQTAAKPKPLPFSAKEAPAANLVKTAGSSTVSLPTSTNRPKISVSAKKAARASALIANANLDLTSAEAPVEPEPSTDIALTGSGAVSTKKAAKVWNTVSQLPGSMQKGIRQLGSSIFGEYTSTPLDSIKVMATPITPEVHLKQVLSTVQHDGQLIADMTYDFEKTIPGYEADAKLFRYAGNDFLAVKDFMGVYVYSWPSSTTKLESNSQNSKYLEFFRKL